MGRHLHCLDLESLDMDFVGRLYGVFVHMMPQFLLDPAVLKVFLVRIEQARDQQKARASTSLEHALVPHSRHHQHQRHQQRNQAAGGSAGLQRGTSGGSATRTPASARRRRLDDLHRDMVARLGKIGVDLRVTATEIRKFHGTS